MNKRPNILFLFPDSHRGDWMPYTGTNLPLRMPHIQQLMQEGVTFTQAVTPSPLCAPARACLAAGVRYDLCDTPSNEADFPLNKKTFYTVLKEAGYQVGGVGKFDLHKPTYWWGLDGWIDDLATLGFTEAIDNAGKIDAIISGKDGPKDPYMAYLYKRDLAQLHIKDMKERKGHGTAPTELPEEAYCDNWITTNAVQMLQGFPAEQPWFLMVNFTGPHGPWDITKRMKDSWQDIPFPLPHNWEITADKNPTEIRQNYAAMLENIDRNIGLILEEIKLRGEWEDTLIVYASDHGEMLGDHGRFGKCVPHRSSVHIPLVLKGPGIRRGESSHARVELQDLAATFTEYAGSSMPEAIDSISLKSVLAGTQEQVRDYLVSALNADGKHNKISWRMISDGTYKLIIKEDEEPELFNVVNDPWETIDIARGNEFIVHELLSALKRQSV
jgi:arylsulfatase